MRDLWWCQGRLYRWAHILTLNGLYGVTLLLSRSEILDAFLAAFSGTPLEEIMRMIAEQKRPKKSISKDNEPSKRRRKLK